MLQTGLALLPSLVPSLHQFAFPASMSWLTLWAPDTFETYFDSHVDLLQRKLQKHSDRLKVKAEETFKIREISSDQLAGNLEREFKNFKLNVRWPDVFFPPRLH